MPDEGSSARSSGGSRQEKQRRNEEAILEVLDESLGTRVRDIAIRAGLSEGTVRKYLKRMARKCTVRKQEFKPYSWARTEILWVRA